MPRVFKEFLLMHIRITKAQDRFIINTLNRRKKRGWPEASKAQYIRQLIEKEEREYRKIQRAKDKIQLEEMLEKGRL